MVSIGNVFKGFLNFLFLFLFYKIIYKIVYRLLLLLLLLYNNYIIYNKKNRVNNRVNNSV